ncbi:MAG TPA: riboflavin synthase [Solirubrobacteraceae bacterium]|nr:riboflavin synthase [Solirubrobacteraceae bacterium]
MFTGLVQELGTVQEVTHTANGVRLTVSAELAGGLREGDSVAVNGTCLTAAAVGEGRFSADVVNETLSRTSLARAQAGTRVNLELPVRVGQPLGGHIVQGHVDGLGRVVEARPDGFARRLRIETEPGVLRYVVVKGSITVDGVSLTVAAVDDRSFTVSLIPETLERTTLAGAEPDTKVNLEVDVLAKYVEKLLVSAE